MALFQGGGGSGVLPLSADAGGDIFTGVGDAIASNDAKNITEDNVVETLNAIELSLLLNRDYYLAGPATAQTQQIALAEADAGIAWLSGPQFLGNAALRKDWMRQGYADRIRGGKYDWYAYYRDPIADDPRLQTASGRLTGQFQEAAQVIGMTGTQLVIVLAVMGIGLWWFLRSKR